MTALVEPSFGVELDDRDRQLAGLRLAALACQPAPQVGEIVAGAGEEGDRRRIAYVWEAEQAPSGAWLALVQFADGGSFYLGDGYCSFSGALDSSESFALQVAPETVLASAWIFHHDHPGAGRGVDFLGIFRVWQVAT